MRESQLKRTDNVGLFKIWEKKFSKDEFEYKMELYRSKMSESLKGKNLGMKLSEEAKIKIGKAGKGRILTEEQKEKIRNVAKKKGRKLKKVTCPFCNKTGMGGNMTRYHFENCKKRK
jgi:hypothetical protein